MVEDKSRHEYLDSAKGIASIIVVLSHIPIYEIDELVPLKNGLDLMFATLHNPTFYFISGFLFKKSVKKYNKKVLFKSKLLDTIGVFSIWTTIIFSFYYVCKMGGALEGCKSYVVLHTFIYSIHDNTLV